MPQLSRLRVLCKPLNSVKRWTPVLPSKALNSLK